MTRRDHARIAPARSGGKLVIAFKKHDVVTVSLELIGSRDTDDAAPEHYDAHDTTGLMFDCCAMTVGIPARLTKIRALHFLVIKQIFAAPGQDNPAALQDIGMIGDIERH